MILPLTIFDFVNYSNERCSKTKTKFFLHGAQSTRNAAENKEKNTLRIFGNFLTQHFL